MARSHTQRSSSGLALPSQTHSAVWWLGCAWLQARLEGRGGQRTVNLWPSSLLPPPRYWLPDQCKSLRRPGRQLAFQRARTTSRALNKCRCDRPGGDTEEGEGGLFVPHLSLPRPVSSPALRSPRTRCAPSDSEGQGGARV